MTEVSSIMAKICNINFWIENDPPPFGTFPKIHPFWKGNASLNRFTRGLDKALQAEEDQEEEECPESLQVIVNYICYMNMAKIIILLQDQCCLLLCLAWAVDKLPCCHRYVETLDNSTKIPMV